MWPTHGGSIDRVPKNPPPVAVGGCGYVSEYPISTQWADAQLQKIHAGSNER
jgi:alkylation response protein AidB-like acyl-CoA dehydrogenase